MEMRKRRIRSQDTGDPYDDGVDLYPAGEGIESSLPSQFVPGKAHQFIEPKLYHSSPVYHRDDELPNPPPSKTWPLYATIAIAALLVFVVINVDRNRLDADHWAAPKSEEANASLVTRENMGPPKELPTRVPLDYWEKQMAAFAVNEELVTPEPLVTEPPATHTPQPTKTPLLKKGMQGDFIRQVQERLAELNYLAPDQVDGKYETSTMNAIKTFQENSYLKADGMAGKETIDSLFHSGAVAMPSPTPRLNEAYVWATVNGTYYHSKQNCSNMKGAQEMPVSQAVAGKKKACPRCNPPQ